MSQILSSAAVVIGALRVKSVSIAAYPVCIIAMVSSSIAWWRIVHQTHLRPWPKTFIGGLVPDACTCMAGPTMA